jgi:hypothetical protein
MYRKRDTTAGWRDSRNVCALSDGDRHLGHIVLKAGQWYSFDATHLNESSNGFRHLGTYHSIDVAKAAVEGSCAKDLQFSRVWIS